MKKYAVLFLVLMTLSIMGGSAAAGARPWGMTFGEETTVGE